MSWQTCSRLLFFMLIIKIPHTMHDHLLLWAMGALGKSRHAKFVLNFTSTATTRLRADYRHASSDANFSFSVVILFIPIQP